VTLIQELINEFDPCCLISLGAPDNEYDCITHQLISKLYNGRSKIELKELILHEIKNHFGFPDLDKLNDVQKLNFYNDLDSFLVKIENIKQPCH